MIKLFGGTRPDHPLADPKEAKRLLDALPAQDAYKALEELTHWQESVSDAVGFKPADRIQIATLIDDAAQPRLRRIGREYAGAVRPSRFQENRMWNAIHDYVRNAGVAFARNVDRFVQGEKGVETARAQLPVVLVRTLRNLAQQIKWMHLRYGPVDPAAWGVLNGVYAYAESAQLADTAVIAYPGVQAETTPRVEFLRAVAFSASSPDSLLPAEVDLAERIIAQVADRFSVSASAQPDCSYWTDLARAMAPARLIQPPAPGAGIRYVATAGAREAVDGLAARVESNREIPAAITQGAAFELDMFADVARHLTLLWSPQPPERKSKRHNVKSRLSVVPGFRPALVALGIPDPVVGGEEWPEETWIVENVSSGGFGAVVTQLKGDWLRVGELLALQPEGGQNWIIGLVRRVNKTSGQQARVGIQTLSRAPAARLFSLGGARGDEHGILLGPLESHAGQIGIALRNGVFEWGQNLAAQEDGNAVVYMPNGLAERSNDYEIAVFRAAPRS